MDISGFISEFLEPKSVLMDDAAEFFLSHILNGYTSAYKMHVFITKELNQQIAYKNVNRRMHRLHQGGLLQEIKRQDGYKHGAINYTLTSKGLVYIFSEFMTPKNILELMVKYPNTSLFKTFIYPYLKKKTLEDSTQTLRLLLMDYLEVCSYHTRYFLDPAKFALYSNSPQLMIKHLEFQLKCDVMSFLLRAAALPKEMITWYSVDLVDKYETLNLLSNDEKFMNALEVHGGNICKGYGTLIELRKKNGVL
jgi:hypothetical protein